MKRNVSIMMVMLILCGCGAVVSGDTVEISKQPVTTPTVMDVSVPESMMVSEPTPTLTPNPTPNPTPTPTPEPESVSIVMVGDILLHTPVEKAALQEDGSYSFDVIFELSRTV